MNDGVVSTQATGRERLAEVVADLRERFGNKAKKLSKANEAATRLLIIDEVLIALGWPKESFHPETRTSDGTYMDYLIKLAGSPRFVVEAKRIGNTFAPSAKTLRKTEYLLSYMRQSFGTPFTEVLRQAEEYCRDVTVPFAVLTNGAEWVVAQVLPPPGGHEERLRCFYIGNIFDESPNIDLLWELLSSTAVGESLLEEAFSILNSLEAEYCAEPRSLIGELRWATPVDHPDLSDFYHCFFDEIIDPGRRNMLEHCYVTSPKLAQYHGELKRTLIDTAPAFLENAEELSPGDTRKVLPDTAGDQKGRVVLVVGSVGAGKSTFVTKSLIENRDVPGLVFVKLELINEAVLHAESPPERLWKLLMDAWIEKHPDALDYQKLRDAFHAEIEQLRRGPSAELFAKNPDRFDEAKAAKLQELVSDPEKCLRRMWPHIARSARARVVVFLDNVDRASETFQHRMYAFAHAVAAETGATVIVTMRESTYYRAKDSGFLDVRTSDKVFHLQAPNVVQLISKRVIYVEGHMHQDYRAAAWKREKDWVRFQGACRRYAAALKVTFLGDNEGQQLLTVLAALAWHNIRAFLATLRRIHTLLAGIDGDGSTRWTENRVLSALLASDTSGSLRAIPATLFRPPSKRHSCFLLKLRLLLLLKAGVRRLEQQQGVGYARIVEFGRVYGYRRRWTETGLEELVRERLAECLQIPAEVEHTSAYELCSEHVFRLSPLGILVVEQLMYKAIYLATSAWELPYHAKDDIDEFMAAAKDALGSEDFAQCELDVESADLLGISEVPAVVARVLAAARAKEAVLVGDLAGRPEVSAVEEKLREALDKLGAAQTKQDTKQTGVARQPGPEPTFGQPRQTVLPLEPQPSPSATQAIKIPIPPTLNDLKLDRSTSAPAVFWALAYAHVNSLGPQSGAEIARIVNEHLRDDYQQLQNTNISRLLRSPSMLKHKWLRRTGTERHWRFSLVPGWREDWVVTFSTEAPG
jgi:hypothetical protein